MTQATFDLEAELEKVMEAAADPEVDELIAAVMQEQQDAVANPLTKK